ncbi:hypothetical protein Dimus_011497 [Dionaea muscipula]
MAARWSHSRLIPYVVGRQHSHTSLFSSKASSQPQASSSTSSKVLSGFEYFRRGIHSESVPASQGDEDAEKNHACSQMPDSNETKIHSPSGPGSSSSAAKYNLLSNLKISPRHDLALIYTCKVCETRSMKTVCRDSYEKGVVVVECDGCNNLHLIADRLGWFGEPGSIEDFLSSRGEEVKRGSVDSLNLTLEDLVGQKG